jgi:ankyrin repeat protein
LPLQIAKQDLAGLKHRDWGFSEPSPSGVDCSFSSKYAKFFMLDQGADPNADGSGYTALHWAAGTWEVQLTGPFGIAAEPGSEWYALAGLQGDAKVDLIKALLAHGANVNARIRRKPPTFGNGGFAMNLVGATPFFVAAVVADIPTMKLLLAHGADASLTMNDKTTPLMVAAGLGRSNGDSRVTDETSLEAVKFLLDLGADSNVANAAGETALHGTAYRGNDIVAQFLVEKGTAVNPKNKNGRTPLDVAEGEFFQGTLEP